MGSGGETERVEILQQQREELARREAALEEELLAVESDRVAIFEIYCYFCPLVRSVLGRNRAHVDIFGRLHPRIFQHLALGG